MTERKFVRVEKPKFHWAESAVSFDCPCGEKEICIDGDDSPHECVCGRVYIVRHYIEVDESGSKQD